MAEPETEAQTDPPAPDGPSDAAKAGLKAIVRETLDEWMEDNKPAPSKTNKTPNWFDKILGM